MRRRSAGLVAACAALSGCLTVHVPRPPNAPSAVERAQRSHEYPAAARPAPRFHPGAAGPVAAVDSFTEAYINWTADTVSADMRRLAALSVGQARSAMQLAAAQTASDYELRRGGIANSGEVEAVAPLARGPHQYVVVTRELTSATATTAYQGLEPAWHVTIATVAQEPQGGWVVSGWQPES